MNLLKCFRTYVPFVLAKLSLDFNFDEKVTYFCDRKNR
jgi:hypothetical protein